MTEKNGIFSRRKMLKRLKNQEEQNKERWGMTKSIYMYIQRHQEFRKRKQCHVRILDLLREIKLDTYSNRQKHWLETRE
jgi:hypothetical protein